MRRKLPSLASPTPEECHAELKKIALESLRREEAEKEAQFATFVNTLDTVDPTTAPPDAVAKRESELVVYQRQHESEVAALRERHERCAEEAASEVLPYVITATTQGGPSELAMQIKPAMSGTMQGGVGSCCYYGGTQACDGACTHQTWGHPVTHTMGHPMAHSLGMQGMQGMGVQRQMVQYAQAQSMMAPTQQGMPMMGSPMGPQYGQPIQTQQPAQNLPNQYQPQTGYAQQYYPPYG